MKNCSEKSQLFIERIKIRTRRGYNVLFAYLPKRGRVPFLFLSSCLLPNHLHLYPPQFAEPLRCSLCSPERPRPAINVMHPQTHPHPPRQHTDVNATIVGTSTLTNTDLVTTTANGQGTYPRAKGLDNTRESSEVMQTQWQSLREQRNRS